MSRVIGTNTLLTIADVPGVSLLYSNTSVPVGNTVNTSIVETAFTSSIAIPSGRLTVGNVIRIKLWGVYGTNIVAPTLIGKIKLGSTTLLNTGALTTIAGVTNVGWFAEAEFIVISTGASGTVEVQGYAEFATAATTGLSVNIPNTAPITVDTTGNPILTVTVQWSLSNVANTISLRNMVVEAVTNNTIVGTGAASGDLTGNYPSPQIAVGAIVNADINASASIDATKINTGVVTNAEFNYLDGVSSAIQTQIDGKQPLDTDLTTIAALTATTDNFLLSVASAWASRTPSQVRTTLALVIGTDIQAYDADLTTWAGITPGTGVATALAVNVGTSGAIVINSGVLGTPSSGTLTNCTFPTLNQNTTGSAASLSISGQTGLVTLAGITSTNRIKTVRDAADTILELGGSYTPSGTWTSVTMVTPVLGTPASGVVTNLTGTASININGTVGATTPAAGTFTLLTASKASLSLDITNSTDAVTNQVGKFSGTNATRAANDLTYQSFFLASSTGVQREFVRFNFKAPVVTNTSEDGSFILSLMTAGTLTDKLLLTKTDLKPVTNDGLSLGTGTLMWSDLFLASGSVVNFNNGDVLITHSADTLTFTGASSGYFYDALNAPNVNDAASLGSATLMWSDLFLASGGVINFNNGNVTLTHSAGVLTIAGAELTLATGTATSSPLNIPAGTLETTPEDGDIEMDANCFYVCTDAGNRGVVPVENLIRQHADRAAFANNANQQAIFDSVANGTLTLETGAYLFEGVIQIKVTSATSGNLKFSLAGAGGGTFAIILYTISAIDAANDTLTAWSGVSEIISTQTVTNMATATIATVTTFFVKGSFECTVAGTLIPSVAQTTAVTTAVTTAGSYFKCNRVGSTTAASVGQWS